LVIVVVVVGDDGGVSVGRVVVVVAVWAAIDGW
jgi:hypothetical protein